MTTYRVEFFIPLNYNDGTEIEPEKHLETRQDLMNHFGGGLTWVPANALGLWIHEGKTYTDTCDLLMISIDDTEENVDFMRKYKEVLKERYKQHDILIYAIRAEIL